MKPTGLFEYKPKSHKYRAINSLTSLVYMKSKVWRNNRADRRIGLYAYAYVICYGKYEFLVNMSNSR